MSTLCSSSGGSTYSRFGVLASLRKIKPCCGLTLQTGAKFVAIGQILIALIEVVISLYVLRAQIIYTGKMGCHFIVANSALKGPFTNPDWEEFDAQSGLNDSELFFWFRFIKFVSLFCLNLFLCNSIQQKLVGRVTLWWRIMCFLTLLNLGLFLYMMIAGLTFSVENPETLFWFLFDVYSLWVIFEYIKELEGASKERPDENNPAVQFFGDATA